MDLIACMPTFQRIQVNEFIFPQLHTVSVADLGRLIVSGAY